MTTTAQAVLQLHHREVFERNVTRALVLGTGAGLVHAVCGQLGLSFPLSYLGTVAAALACVAGDKWDRPLLMGLALAAPALPFALDLAPLWTVALAGAAAGAVMVRARLCDKGEEGQVAAHRPGLASYLLSALGSGGFAVAGLVVARTLGQRLGDFETPLVLTWSAVGAALSLFVALGSIGAHLALRPDPVEARCEEVIPRLEGELRTLMLRMVTLYRQCGQSLALLPREPAREELARTLSQLTRQSVELASEWTSVETQLEESAFRELKEQIGDLEACAAKTRDPVARRQLELTAASLREEVGRLEEMGVRRERIVAKLKSEVALLDRARVALLGMRSGQAQLKSVELSALARKLGALAQSQRAEGELVQELATGAEIAQQEAASADRPLRS
ncbi:MAG: hypothetical protein ACT4TC_04620 [Myxococcaceae bacterium]